MEQERLEKQEYLKTEILEKNYSPDEFMEYCEELKGAEIDMYTLAELKTIVNDFISRKSQIEEISVPESFVDPPVHQAKVDLRLDPQFEKRSENSAYSISAIKMHDNALSLEDVITITVSE